MAITVSGTFYGVDGFPLSFATLRFRPVVREDYVSYGTDFTYPLKSISTGADDEGFFEIDLHGRQEFGQFSDDALYVMEYVNPFSLQAIRFLVDGDDGDTLDASDLPVLSFLDFILLKSSNRVGV